MPVGEGYLNFTAEYKDRAPTNRSGADPRRQYAGVNPKELTFDRFSHRFGDGQSQEFNFFLNAAAPLFDTVVAERTLASAERPLVALAEITRTLKHGGRAVIIEDFDSLSSASPANPISTLRDWFAKAGLEVSRIRPVDTEAGHLLVAIGRRVARSTAAA